MRVVLDRTFGEVRQLAGDLRRSTVSLVHVRRQFGCEITLIFSSIRSGRELPGLREDRFSVDGVIGRRACG